MECSSTKDGKHLYCTLIMKSSLVRITATVFTLLFLCTSQIGMLRAQDDALTLCDSIPYNPDSDCDGVITTFDFLPLFSLFGDNFTPEADSLIFPVDLDPDPTNELQWLAIDGDTLRLLLQDSSVYSSIFIGGADGADGADGLSAFDIWIAQGNTGTESDFLASLIGADGAPGADGAQGVDGAPGADGIDGAPGAPGADGFSAYAIWINAGNEGSEADFLASLIGADGAPGADGAQGVDGAPGADGIDGAPGAPGADGLSAYAIWINAGNEGSEADFLASLVGENGADGPQGEPGEPGATGPAGPQGETGADGVPGLSAYEVWLGLGNEGSEADFIAYLSGGEAFSPSSHGVFDSESDGTTFAITEAVATVSIELWGASGGSGGDICGQTLGAASCNLCSATGGAGGRALKMVSMVYNLVQGDVLTLVPGDAGVDSGELITCNPGITGWTEWDCGPASSGTDGGVTQLLLNGEVIAEVSGATGGTGACIGCQGDGCFNGDAGSDGALNSTANWMTVLSSDVISENTGSRLILRY